MWVSGVDWDKAVGENLSLRATPWFSELSALPGLQIPRCVRTTTAIGETTAFVDKFEKLYGPACYVTHLYEYGAGVLLFKHFK